jgi:DUF177 domain-containing protein
MRDYPTTHLDPRSPLVLDTRDLPRSPGAMRVVERVIAAPKDLGLELIRVPEGADLALTLRLESVSEGVLVSAQAQGRLTGECGRCLREINEPLDVTFQELYAYQRSTTDETTDEDEVGRMQGDLIDLEPELRDAVPADHHHRQVDQRWAALQDVRIDTEE